MEEDKKGIGIGIGIGIENEDRNRNRIGMDGIKWGMRIV